MKQVIHQLSAAEERAGTADAKLFAVLADVLGRSDSASAIVFANRKTDCDELAARIRLHALIRGMYSQFEDPETGQLFYYNKATGEKGFAPPTLDPTMPS